MLRELHISGLGVIDDLDVELHGGLNVLTGETGAGKTMVTVGLSLALGARGSATMVRDGATAARVEARFDAPPDAGDWAEDGEVVLARSVGADGRSSARISGRIATASALAELGGSLVELHGQHQVQRLLSPAVQTALLDRFAGDGHGEAVAAHHGVWERWRRCHSELEQLMGQARDREREADLLAYQVGEIEAVGPRPDESIGLAAEEERLAHVERLLELGGVAQLALEEEPSAIDALGAVASALDEAGVHDPVAEALARRAHGLAAELAELARDARTWRESLQVDPARLQDIRDRLHALRALQRKYGETDADVIAYLREAAERLASLSGGEERRAALAAELETLTLDLTRGADRISSDRARAAPGLASALGDELTHLGMPGATVVVALEPLDGPGPDGAERVELRFAPGPGLPVRALSATASGGELSRTMLACRSVLADLDDVPTLVFDEVDAGIGGEAGLAVGRRLAALAATRQVVVVTHLPQIACFADRHVRVEKRGSSATVAVLDEDERVRELSRMLAGLTESEGAVTHAEELLAAAAADRAVRS